MPLIAPTITTDNMSQYVARLDDFVKWAPIIHIDICDGTLTESRTISLNQIYLPSDKEFAGKIAIHLMSSNFAKWANQIVSLHPDVIFIHATAEQSVSVKRFANFMHMMGVECGLVVGSDNDIQSIASIVPVVDRVLLFGGKLGYQGGVADLNVLHNVGAIKEIKPAMIFEYDGGANAGNVQQIAAAGIDVINVGSAISNSDNAELAYRGLVELVDGVQ